MNRFVPWLLVGLASTVLMLHGAGWIAAAVVFWQSATLHVPRVQSSRSASRSLFCVPPLRRAEAGGVLSYASSSSLPSHSSPCRCPSDSRGTT